MANPLRPIVHKLNNAAVENLPQYAGFLASSILQCGHLLREQSTQRDDVSVALHRLRTRVSALIQDKTPEGRLTGLILAKAIIDAGGSQELTASTAWARMILSCLNKTDPPEIKKLALITITRIFLLTVNQPSLVREITTPNLPSFISTTLSLMRPTEVPKTALGNQVTSPASETVIQCWLYLLPEFSSLFRPYVNSLKAITLSMLNDERTPQHLQLLFTKLFAALPWCSPRNVAITEWEKLCQQIFQSFHQNANVVFRSIVEEWMPLSTYPGAIGGKISIEAKTKSADLIGLDKWLGLKAGTNRLQILLRMLSSLLTQCQTQPVSVPLAEVLDVTGRIACVFPPTSAIAMRNNPDVSRDERDELWLYMPGIHLAVLGVLQNLVVTYGQALRPIGNTMLLQVLDIFESNIHDKCLRAKSYVLMHNLLSTHLVQVMQPDSPIFFRLIKSCCQDLEDTIPPTNIMMMRDKSSKVPNGSVAEISTSRPTQPSSSQRLLSSSDLQAASRDLLSTILETSTDVLSSVIRNQIDRSIILADHKEAMLASILNPQHLKGRTRTHPSILPFLARTNDATVSIESLLRPRMPLLRIDLHESGQSAEANETDMQDALIDQPNQHDRIQSQEVSRTQQQPTSQSPRKREFAIFDSDLGQFNGDDAAANKKPRESSPPNHPADQNFMPVVGIVEDVHGDSAPTDDVNDEDVSSLDATTTSSLPRATPSQPAGKPDAMATDEPISNKMWTSTAGVSDSSDDEIPEIDATISDDEIEEEDGEDGD